MWHWLKSLAAPKNFYRWSGRIIPYLAVISIVLFVYGLWGGLVQAPADYQQGNGFRIIYVHVPAAFLSLSVYVFMAIAAAISIIWRIKLADSFVAHSASLGAWFTVIALVTGSLWGKPMWGTWWIWDARLTSELILLFLYLGIIALLGASHDRKRTYRAANLLTLIGIINIPIIHYSVYWWNTLHQGATLSKFAKPSIAPAMLHPLLVMILAFFSYYLWIILLRMRAEIAAN